VNAQSPSAAPTGATQALYSSPAPAAPVASPSGMSGVPAAGFPPVSVPPSSVRNGLYEPQTGLYVPAGGNGQ
jgi:hypothetical protein